MKEEGMKLNGEDENNKEKENLDIFWDSAVCVFGQRDEKWPNRGERKNEKIIMKEKLKWVFLF